MTPIPAPSVLARMADLLHDVPVDQGAALWRLAPERRQLDANVVRLAPGTQVTSHLEPDLDVLLYVTGGSGRLEAEEGQHALEPGCVVWLPHGTCRALSAGSDGLTYLTVHRRQGLAIRRAAEPEGGEMACLLHRVCPECGRLAPERDAQYCSRCGTHLPSE